MNFYKWSQKVTVGGCQWLQMTIIPDIRLVSTQYSQLLSEESLVIAAACSMKQQ